MSESKVWQPMPSGTRQWSEQEGLIVRGKQLELRVRPLVTFYDSFGEPHQRLATGIESVEVTLPDDLAVCQLVEQPEAGVMTPELVSALDCVIYYAESYGDEYKSSKEAIYYAAGQLRAMLDALAGAGGEGGE